MTTKRRTALTPALESVGYTDCSCRDCFNISIDNNPCALCEAAGCDLTKECQAEGAYGVDEESAETK